MVRSDAIAVMIVAILAAMSKLADADPYLDAITNGDCKAWFEGRIKRSKELTGVLTPVLRTDKHEICLAAIPGVTAARTKSLIVPKFWVCYDTTKCNQIDDFIRTPLPCDVKAAAAADDKRTKDEHELAVVLLDTCVKMRDRALDMIRAACSYTSAVIKTLDACLEAEKQKLTLLEALQDSDLAMHGECEDKAINANVKFFEDLFKQGCHKKQLEITRCFLTNATPNLAGKTLGEVAGGKCATKGAFRWGCTGAGGRQEMLTTKAVGDKVTIEKKCPDNMTKDLPGAENPTKATENYLL